MCAPLVCDSLTCDSLMCDSLVWWGDLSDGAEDLVQDRDAAVARRGDSHMYDTLKCSYM